LIVGVKVIFDVIEFEIRQAASDFSIILCALAFFASSDISRTGFSSISLITNFPSTFSKVPTALTVKE
jgi:hypothetical protein